MRTRAFIFVIVALAIRLGAADAAKPARRAAGAANRPALAGRGLAGGAGFEQILTDEQREQLRAHLQEQRSDFRENTQKAAQLRRELNEAVFSGKADEKFIKEKTEAIAKLDAEQMRVRMMALTKIAGTFTAEQKEKLKEMSGRLREARRGLTGGPGGRDGDVPRKVEPAAPPPPEK